LKILSIKYARDLAHFDSRDYVPHLSGIACCSSGGFVLCDISQRRTLQLLGCKYKVQTGIWT